MTRIHHARKLTPIQTHERDLDVHENLPTKETYAHQKRHMHTKRDTCTPKEPYAHQKRHMHTKRDICTPKEPYAHQKKHMHTKRAICTRKETQCTPKETYAHQKRPSACPRVHTNVIHVMSFTNVIHKCICE